MLVSNRTKPALKPIIGLRRKIRGRERRRSCLFAPQQLVFEVLLRVPGFEGLWLACGAETLTKRGCSP